MKDLISRFAPALILSIVGIGALIVGSQTGQGSEYMIGGGALLLVAIVVLLNAIQVLNNMMSIIASVVLLVAAVVLAYFNFDSINRPIQFLKEKESRYAYVIQGLKDIREAQLAFKKLNGNYAPTFDSLKTFILTDSIPVVKKTGSVQDGMTMQESIDSGFLTLDTNLIPAQEVIYNVDYTKARFVKHELDISNIDKVPFTEGVFNMEVGTVERTGGLEVPVIEVTDGAPFDENDVMKFGSLSDPSTSGNWKEEK
jgi:hypothetical protein